MIYFPTLISIIEVLLVTVPVLLTVAYVTVAERKTMASMQRRLGPNAVGYLGLLQALKGKNINRCYHTSRKLYNPNDMLNTASCTADAIHLEAIKELFRDRVALVKVFDKNLLATCSDILNLKERSLFFQELSDTGGIYLIQYKYDLNIYYIGRTINFQNRFRSHIKHKLTDRFHLFATIVGWDSFDFSVIEVCSSEQQGARENWYLQEYLPLLNTNFISKYSEATIYKSLYDILESNRTDTVLNNNRTSISIYAYKYTNSHIDKAFVQYDSVNSATKATNIARETIRMYLNTNVPYKGLLFYSKTIDNFESILSLVKSSSAGLELYSKLAKKVWIYTLSDNQKSSDHVRRDTCEQCFVSREKACEFLKVNSNMIRSHIDSLKPGGINGHYLFSKPLSDKEFKELVELSTIQAKKNQIKVWVYEVKTLKLINNSPFNSMKKTGDHFNVDYRAILSNLDTRSAVNKNGIWVYFFSSELSATVRDELLNNLNLAKNITTPLWVYKKQDVQRSCNIVLINENSPTYVSKLKASTDLGITTKKISKIIDTGESYKDLLFYSFPLQ